MGPYSPVDLSANTRPQIGLTDACRPVYESYLPTALSLADRISRIAADEGTYTQHIPVPQGMSLGMNHARSQLQLVLGDFETPFLFLAYRELAAMSFSVFNTGTATREDFAGRAVTSAKYTSPWTGTQQLPPATFRLCRCFHGGMAATMMK